MDDLEKLFDYQGPKLRSDEMEIKLAFLHAQTEAIERRARAIDKLTEAHLRNAEAMERALRAMNALDQANVNLERKPPARLLPASKRKRA